MVPLDHGNANTSRLTIVKKNDNVRIGWNVVRQLRNHERSRG